ncbi:MAG TPA: hypothetical protein VLC55_11175 [Burkholderiales bacterium]|nr:hypothetical protein [Burkholderiales bacterium]
MKGKAGIATLVAGLALALGLAPLFAGSGKEQGRTPLPSVAVEKSQSGEKCVRDTEWMRRNHMTLLKHQRDDTMYRGVRGTDEALRNCINCHASKQTGSVIGSDQAFCQGCHSYASVSLDCWECHNPKKIKAAEAKP